MNAVWAHRYDEDDDDDATAARPTSRAMLDAMMRQIQTDLRSEARTEVACDPPPSGMTLRTPPAIPRPPPLPKNPFLEPAKAGDPPAPWAKTRTSKKPVATVRSDVTRRRSRPVLALAFLLMGIAFGVLVSCFWRHPKADALVARGLAFFTLQPTTPTLVTEVRVEPLTKVLRSDDPLPIPRKKSKP